MIRSRKLSRDWTLRSMCLVCAVALAGFVAHAVGGDCVDGCICTVKMCNQSSGGDISYYEHDAARCLTIPGEGAFSAFPDNLFAGQERSYGFFGWTEENGFTRCPCNVGLDVEDFFIGLSAGGGAINSDWRYSEFNTYCNHCE